MIKDFKSFNNKSFNKLNENDGYLFLPKKTITNEELNNMPEDQLKRIILGCNDGQGDHATYTIEQIMTTFATEGSSISDTINSLYDKNNGFLTGNNCDWRYFDDQYYEIEWK